MISFSLIKPLVISDLEVICFVTCSGVCVWMENGNIAGGDRVMHQEENQLPMSGYLDLFETWMSGYLGLFEACVTKFVQICVSLLLLWVCLCLCFFGENMELFAFMGFFVCLFLKKNSRLMGLLEIELVTGFMSLFLRFI